MRHSVERLSDVTEQLHRSEQLSSAIVEQAADAIWTIDEHGAILLANDSSELLTGVAEADQIGRPLSDYLDTIDGESFVVAVDGSSRKVLVASSAIDADADQVTTVIAHDISERSRFESELAFQARHDLLTGLPNRFAAMEHLESLLADDIDFALLFIDIDGFKSVNDTQGHEAGDGIYADVAGRLVHSLSRVRRTARRRRVHRRADRLHAHRRFDCARASHDPGDRAPLRFPARHLCALGERRGGAVRTVNDRVTALRQADDRALPRQGARARTGRAVRCGTAGQAPPRGRPHAGAPPRRSQPGTRTPPPTDHVAVDR